MICKHTYNRMQANGQVVGLVGKLPIGLSVMLAPFGSFSESKTVLTSTSACSRYPLQLVMQENLYMRCVMVNHNFLCSC